MVCRKQSNLQKARITNRHAFTEGVNMRKITLSLIGFAFLLCAFSANAAGLGEPCIVDADCNDSVYCNGIESCSSEGSICVAGIVVDCGDQICDEGSQACVECQGDLDCLDNETPFCSEGLECVECLNDLDCADGQVCDQGVCAEEIACGLFIKPPVLNMGKKGKQAKQMFTIKGILGEEGFDPYGDIVFGPFEIYRSFVDDDCNVLKVQILVPGNVVIEGDSFDVSVGSCVGQVYVKTPGYKDDLKEQKRLENQQKKEAQMAEKLQKKLEKQGKKGK